LNAAFYQDENGQFHIREPHSCMLFPVTSKTS
jgi:hypothetical protein